MHSEGISLRLQRAQQARYSTSRIIQNNPRFVKGENDEKITWSAGHWIQQERPQEVNELLVEFAKSIT